MLMRYLIVVSILILITGCASASRHRQLAQDDTGDRITVGKVQREIKVGMSSADVAEAIGSPNIVSTDEERREVWIYDKISTDVAYSTSEAGIAILVVGVGSSGAKSTSQRTLTIIIKFDHAGKVRDFAYHTSRF